METAKLTSVLLRSVLVCFAALLVGLCNGSEAYPPSMYSPSDDLA